MATWLLDGAERAEYIRGLRACADWLEAHPGVGVDRYQTSITTHPSGTDEEAIASVDAFAEIAGVAPERQNRFYSAAIKFGPFVEYEAVAITRAAIDDYRAVQELGEAALATVKAATAEYAADAEHAADVAADDEAERQGREIDTAVESTGHMPGSEPKRCCCEDGPDWDCYACVSGSHRACPEREAAR